MINETISHYKVLAKLGEGGMGIVYKARDLKLDRPVALKFLPAHLSEVKQEKARFVQEAKAASALDHPNICAIYEIDQTEDGRMFIAMAHYDGVTLRERIEAEQLELKLAVSLGLQVAQGLARAHENQIVHRDIKPANIIVTSRGEAKILDFGLAKLAGQARLTQAGETLGTAAYMSPEQIQGQEIDHRSDIFSWGVLMYEMLCRTLPFAGDYGPALMYAILHDDPKPLAEHNLEVPGELGLVVQKALAKRPQDRYQDTNELVADLLTIQRSLDSGSILARPLTAGPSAAGQARQADKKRGMPFSLQKTRVAILALALAVVIISGVVWFSGSFDGDVPDSKHIAVLGFTNVGGGPEVEALCVGLEETLTSNLSQLEQFQGELWVVPSSEIRSGAINTASEAFKAFGANLVITGSVQRFTNLLRLTINLIDARTLRQVASKVIDDPMTSVSVLQDDVMIILAQMLNVELLPQGERLLKAGATTVPGAYEFYLQGRGNLQRYDQLQSIDSAIQLFHRALEKDPKYGQAFAGLGEAFLRKFQETREVTLVDSAEHYCERAVQIDRLMPAAHVTLGLLYNETGRNREALSEFQNALELDASNADAYRGRATAFMDLGQLQEAEGTYNKAISMKRDYWGGYNDLGVFYFRHGRYQDAIPQFQHVVELTPQNTRGYLNLGAMYFSLNEYEKAIEYYNRALDIEPTYAAYSNLATLYFNQKKYADAAQMFEKSLELRDTDYRVWGYLASCYREIGEKAKFLDATEKAIEGAQQMLRVKPNDPSVLLSLASYYIDIKKESESRATLEKVISLNPQDVSIYFGLGYVFELLGQREEALRWIGKAVQNGFDLAQIENNPNLRDLRADLRFKEISRK